MSKMKFLFQPRRDLPKRGMIPLTFALIMGGSHIGNGYALSGDENMVTEHEKIQQSLSDPSKGFEHWHKPTQETLAKTLTSLQYEVTQKEGTEPPFKNAYWDNKAPGIYVDIVSGEPLFSSTHKYKSGTGWPSFWQPINIKSITEHTDRKLWSTRTEVRSLYADSHLGHVFDDGPAPTGKRYCINSAALRFVPLDELEAQGYGEFLSLFER